MPPTATLPKVSLMNRAAGFTGGGTALITNSTILTHGDDADGVLTANGGLTTVNGGSINTTGNAAYAVSVDTGGIVKLTGTTIGTTGDGSGGLAIHSTTSEIDATGVSITTEGGFDPVSGQHSYGVYNGPFGSFPTGGVAKLTDTSVSTHGAQMYGVITSTGGSTTILGGSISTAGLGASGVVTENGASTSMSGGTVATTGQDAHALFVTGSGSQANLSGSGTFATQGAGAIGLYATLGGVISATGVATITTAGGVSSATGLSAFGVNADGAGSQITLGAATITTSGAGATALFASDAAASGSAGAITATGTLNIATTNAPTAAVALQGNGASVLATGGGSIVSAGNAIAFLGGTGQSATFDNFTIGNLSGDLIFADPSLATVNFNNTIANAGANNLLDATAGSVVTLNANASTLTGAIRTDPTSTSNVNLANGTTWNMTGSSTVTNLSVTNSVVVFAPPSSGAAFKTLTVTNYVGAGANITLNASLGGSNSSSDQIIVNGGKATVRHC